MKKKKKTKKQKIDGTISQIINQDLCSKYN